MATIHWINTAGGSFNTATNWNPAQVPVAGDDAIIDAVGSYTVTSSTNNTVKTLAIVSTATLADTAGNFSIQSGSGTGGIAGIIAVGNGAVLSMNGTLTGTGTIQENSAGSTTDIHVAGTAATLSGGIHLTMGDNANNRILGNAAADQLINAGGTIAGAGQLGAGQLTLTNKRLINATGVSNALIVNTGAKTITNSGTMEATAVGGLVIQSTVNNVGGTIKAVGTSDTVTLESSIQGGTLTTSTGGLIVTAGGGAQLDGTSTHPVTNSGSLQVSNGTVLTLDGTINNTGSILESSAGSTTDIHLGSPTVTLQGAGALVMGDNVNNRILGNAVSFQLVNASTIRGAGQLGVGQMTLTNQSLINATGANALTLNTSGQIATNTGTLEDTNTGGLVIANTAVNNSGGTVQAVGAGSHVDLNGSSIEAGTLATSGGGVIQTTGGGGGLDGLTVGALTNTGTVQVNNGTVLTLYGTINNTGSILESSAGSTTDIHLGSQTVTLQGGGALVMGDNINNRVLGNEAGYQLINVNNTISGAGQLGAGQMTLTNQAGGLIDATGANALTLNTNNNVVINAGTMEDTNTGGLAIVNTAVNNTGGTVQAVGAGSHVDLNGSQIEAGTLASSGGGVIQTTGNGGILDGLTVGALTNTGTVQVNNSTVLTLYGTINNTGSILENSAGSTTDIHLGSQTVTLQGGGALIMSDNANNRILGNAAGYQLVNVNDTIAGAGQLGAGQMTLNNQSLINATGTANALILDTAGQIVTNTGTLEDTNTGGLAIVNTAINNTGGTVQAVGAGSHVDLNGSQIEAGTLASSGGGVIQTTGNGGILDGLTVGALTNTGTVQVNNSTVLTLYGTINNTGSILENSAGSTTDIRLGGQTVTLQGGGALVMSDNANNRVLGNEAGYQLINVDNTISGAGQLGAGQMTLINQAGGLIDASGANALTLNTVNYVVTNAGTMEDTSTGGLVILNTAVNNTGGTVQAVGAGSHVDLNGSGIEAGTLATSGGGVIQTTGNGGFLDGLTVGALTNTGTVQVNNGTVLTLYGTINNTGSILENSAGSTTDIHLGSQTVTLQGGGALVMSDNANNRFFGNAAGFQLVNVDNTISGAGQFGVGQMRLSNSGSIVANGANALTINLGGEDGVNNAGGVLLATGAGGMTLQGFFTNNGTEEADNGSSIVYQSGAVENNNAGGVLTGGTWKAISTGGGATVAINGGAVTTDQATIIMSGTNSVFEAGNGGVFTHIENSLTTIAAGATLEVLGNRGYTSTLKMTDSGFLQLGGKTFSPGSLTIAAGGTVFGNGVVIHGLSNSGLIEANGGLLNLNTTVGGTTGTLQIDNAATLEIAKTSESAQYATGAVATLALSAPASFTGHINNIALGDTIDFIKTTVTNAVINGSTLDVTISGGTTLHYGISGNLTGNHFTITSDGHGGSDITLVDPPATASTMSSTSTTSSTSLPNTSLANLAGSIGFDDIFAGSSLTGSNAPDGWSGGPEPSISGAFGPPDWAHAAGHQNDIGAVLHH